MKALQSFVFFLIFSIICGHFQLYADSPCTTPNIKEIFLGRCYQYLYSIHKSPKPIKYEPLNCITVWNTFKNGFDSEKEKQDYKGFFDLFISENLNNQALFWSKTKKIAHEYTSVTGSLYTLEDTLPGYLANDLTWCGCTVGTLNCKEGIYYGICDRPCNTVNKYWELASIKFSEMAKGVAFVMLNGGLALNKTFQKDSYFTNYELPTIIQNGKVKKLIVLLINSLDQKKIVNCLILLDHIKSEMKDIAKMDLNCIDQPKETLFLLCAENPYACNVMIKNEDKANLKKARKVRKVGKHNN